MPPKDLVNRILSDLQQLAQQLEGVSDLEERLARAKADVDSMNSTRDRVRTEMREAQSLLTQAQRDAQKNFEQDMFDKQGKLMELTGRVNGLQKKLAELTEEVNTKDLQLASVNGAMEDARRRLAG